MEFLASLGLFSSSNDGDSNNNNHDREEKIHRSERNERDIYNSHGYRRVKDISERLSKEKFDDSMDPDRTGVIPKYYNSRKRSKRGSSNMERFGSDSDISDSEYSDEGSCYTMDTMRGAKSVDFNDPAFFLNQQDRVMDNRKHERRVVKKKRDNNNFLSQFDSLRFDNPTDPSSYNAVSGSRGTNAQVKRMETERTLAMDGGYSNFGEGSDNTYGIFPSNKLTHNNMVPFFSGKGMGYDPVRDRHKSSIHQRKMETFTGSVKDPSYKSKKEQAPLFSPIVGYTNIYGNSVNTSDFEGRYIPGKERRNELPFQQVRVTPGLALGANQEAKFGLHDPHRVMPRTTDEIRGPRGPKISYGGVIVPGMKGERGPVVGKQVKRTPDRFKEWGDERMVKGLGYIRAPTSHGEFNPKNMATMNRGTKDQQWYGTAHSNHYSTPDNMRGKYRQTSRQGFKQAEPRNIMLVEGLGARPDSNSYIPDPTQRSQNNKYTGPLGTVQRQNGHAFDVINGVPEVTKRDIHKVRNRAGGAGGSGMGNTYTINYVDNTPQPTKRDIHSKTDRVGAAVKGGHGGHHTYDLSDVPNVTKRNIHSKTDRVGTAVQGGHKGHHTYDPSVVPNVTKRNMHSKTDRAGTAVQGGHKGHHTYDPSDVPNVTKRNIHGKTDRVGTAVQGGHKGHHTYDPSDVPNVTKRNIHSKTDRVGTAIQGGHKGHHTYDPSDVPNVTKRNIHSKTDRVGTAIQGGHKGHHTYDPSDVPNVTKRNIHSKTDRAGTAIQGGHKGHHTYDPSDVPNITKRNIHSKTDRAGTAIQGGHKGHHTYDPSDVPNITKRNIHSKTDRAGTAIQGGHKGHHTYDPSDVPNITKRNIHSKTDRAGAAVRGGYGGHHVNNNDVPEPTRRDIHKSSRSAGGAGYDHEKPFTFNYVNAIPDPTRRDQHKSSRSAGGAGYDHEKPFTFNYINAIPDPTRRDQHKSSRNAGGAKSKVDKQRGFNYINAIPDPTRRDQHKSKRNAGGAFASEQTGQRSRRDAFNMSVNISKEQIAKGRAPTNSSYDKGPTFQFTEVQLRDPIHSARELEVIPDYEPSNCKLVPKQSYNGNTTYYVNKRILSHIEENLAGNPFINNIVHRSPQ